MALPCALLSLAHSLGWLSAEQVHRAALPENNVHLQPIITVGTLPGSGTNFCTQANH